MTDQVEAAPGPPEAGGHRGRRLKRRFLAGLAILVIGTAGYFIGAAVIPRWWSHRVGGVVDGKLSVGSLVGIVVGAIFTFLPLLALWAGVRFRAGFRRILPFLVLATVLALPNLFLLGIVFGTGNAAHAGERTLDVDAPGFRGGSLVGAILGAIAFVAVLYLVLSRGASRRKASRLRDELRERSVDQER